MPRSLNEFPVSRPVSVDWVKTLLTKAVMSGAEVIIFRCPVGPGFFTHEPQADYNIKEVMDLRERINDNKTTAYALRHPKAPRLVVK